LKDFWDGSLNDGEVFNIGVFAPEAGDSGADKTLVKLACS
jgi:hypothetical protein